MILYVLILLFRKPCTNTSFMIPFRNINAEQWWAPGFSHKCEGIVEFLTYVHKGR
jgi:hypothetical protein